MKTRNFCVMKLADAKNSKVTNFSNYFMNLSWAKEKISLFASKLVNSQLNPVITWNRILEHGKKINHL